MSSCLEDSHSVFKSLWCTLRTLILNSKLLEDKGYFDRSSFEQHGFLGQYLYDTKLRQGKTSRHSICPILFLVCTKRWWMSKHFKAKSRVNGCFINLYFRNYRKNITLQNIAHESQLPLTGWCFTCFPSGNNSTVLFPLRDKSFPHSLHCWLA